MDRRTYVLSWVGLVAACIPASKSLGASGSDETSDGASPETSDPSLSSSPWDATTGDDTNASDGTTAASTSSTTAADTSAADDGPVCILHHHETSAPGDCWTDTSCCAGEKCVPSRDYSSCVPLDDTPAAVGEPCMRRGVVDDCVAGAVCRGEDMVTGDGRCVEFCDLGHDCDAPADVCVSYPLLLCLRECDPLMPMCPGTDACLPMASVETFACVPDELPHQDGGLGAPCVPIDAYAGCDAGSICVPDEAVAIDSCMADLDSGCCTTLCDLADPDACAGVASGICEPMHTLLFDFWADEQYGVGYCR